MEQLLSGAPIDTAIGVLQVTVHSARSLKGTKIGGGTPDPYVAQGVQQSLGGMQSLLSHTVTHKLNIMQGSRMRVRLQAMLFPL